MMITEYKPSRDIFYSAEAAAISIMTETRNSRNEADEAEDNIELTCLFGETIEADVLVLQCYSDDYSFSIITFRIVTWAVPLREFYLSIR